VGGLKEAWLAAGLLVLFAGLVLVQPEPGAALDEKKGCYHGVCPMTCCQKYPGFDACCCISPSHKCKCPKEPIDPGLWDKMTKDWDG